MNKTISAERKLQNQGRTALGIVIAVFIFWLGMGVDFSAHLDLAKVAAIVTEELLVANHYLLLAGIALCSAVTGISVLRHILRGERVPLFLAISFFGSVVLAVASASDFFWHLKYGIERLFYSEVSWTHLLLLFGIGTTMGGPLLLGWQNSQDKKYPTPLFLASIVLLVATTTAILHSNSPFGQMSILGEKPSFDNGWVVGQTLMSAFEVYGFLIPLPFLIMGMKWNFFPGTGLFFVTVSVALQTMFDSVPFRGIYAALITGVVIDVLLLSLDLKKRRDAIAFSTLSSLAMSVIVITITWRTSGTWVEPTGTIGFVVLAGTCGFLAGAVVSLVKWLAEASLRARGAANKTALDKSIRIILAALPENRSNELSDAVKHIDEVLGV